MVSTCWWSQPVSAAFSAGACFHVCFALASGSCHWLFVVVDSHTFVQELLLIQHAVSLHVQAFAAAACCTGHIGILLVMMYMYWLCKLLCCMCNPVKEYQGDRQGLHVKRTGRQTRCACCADLACLPGDPLHDCMCNRVAHMTRVAYIQITKCCKQGFQP